MGLNSYAQSTSDQISRDLKIKCKQFYEIGEFDSAYLTAFKLKLHAKELKDTVLLLNSYHRLGFYANKLSDIVKTLEYYNEGINLKVSPQKEVYKLPLLYGKCGVLNDFGDIEEAKKIAVHGIELARKNDSIEYIYLFHNDLAIASANNYEFDMADDFYKKALNFVDEDIEKARVLNNIAVNYKHQKKYNQAARMYDSILKFIEFESPKLRAAIKSNWGFALSKIGKRKKALSLLKEALTTRLELKNFSQIFASYIHLADYYSKFDKSQAGYYAKKAYKTALEKTKSSNSQVEALSYITNLNLNSDEEAKRYVFLTDSLKRAKRRSINLYTAAKFQVKERETEIANQKQEIAKKETQNSYYQLGLVIVVICLFSFFIYVRQRKKILSRNHKIATLEARENERNNISGKVHDFVADKMRDVMSSADQYETKHPNIGFASLADKVESAYQELRKVSKDYMHLNFEKIDFPKHLQNLFEEREKSYSIAIDTEGIGEIEWSLISIPLKTELYRSLQELLVNAYKHSKATQIFISFKEEKKKICMKVEDNGIGCNFTEDIANTGLTDLRRRVNNLGGSINIISSPMEGFFVNIGIPLT